MKRRLNLALALINDPEILVLDEPEAGLDPQNRVLVREFIRLLARHKTVILTTHNMDEAERVADRVAIIDQGRLVALDTPDALKRTVGEGDVLEIGLAPGSNTDVAEAALHKFEPVIATSNDMLTMRCRGAVERLPELLTTLHSAGIQTGEVRLRANTLEDVFITLTGRSLRQ
jgi:ABC-2 type transport system ATP-binding protein